MDIMQILWSYLLRSKKSKECESNLPHSEQKGSQILNRLQNGNYKPAPSDCTGSDANGYSHRNNHIRYGPSPWGSVQLCRAHCRIRFRHKRRQAHPTLPGDQCRGGGRGGGLVLFPPFEADAFSGCRRRGLRAWREEARLSYGKSSLIPLRRRAICRRHGCVLWLGCR